MVKGFSQEELERALDERRFSDVRSMISDSEPADVAESIGFLDAEKRTVVYRVLSRELATEVFEHLGPDAQEELIKGLGREQVAAILNDMAPDDRTSLLEELPAAVTKQVLAMLSPEERRVANQLLGYPEDSVGRMMTPDYIAIRSGWTVQQALDHLRRNGEDSETLSVLPVMDDRGALIDDLRVRQLLLAEPDSKVEQLLDGNFIALKATDDQESAVQVFKEYDRVAFPVTDSAGTLLGIVTVDDVLDVAEEEATEDIQKIGGSAALERPFMQVGFGDMLRKRAGWLVLLFLAQLLSLNVIALFDEKLAQLAVLMLFVPLIISSGGNSGSQAATLVVRAMALEEVTPGDWWRVLRREVAFGLTVGVILAVIGFVRISLGSFSSDWFRLALAVSVSVTCVVLWGVILGSMLPFIMRAFGVDPASSSTPFVATLVDVTGLLLYFTIAVAIIGV
ncbi:MAG: magnesium transporter [Acidobacteria bacterium]|nr:MAG: magnesium transporter [Acidobacteriota bacterium]